MILILCNKLKYHGSKRWQFDIDALGFVVRWLIGTIEKGAGFKIAATVITGIRIQNELITAGFRYADSMVVVGHWRKIADHDQTVFTLFVESRET